LPQLASVSYPFAAIAAMAREAFTHKDTMRVSIITGGGAVGHPD